MEIIYICIYIYINSYYKSNTQSCIFNLSNRHSFCKIVCLNFFKYNIHFKPFLSNKCANIFLKKIHILNPIHEFRIFNLPNFPSFRKTIYLNLFNTTFTLQEISVTIASKKRYR